MITLHSIKNMLLPGLHAVTGKYKEVPPEWEGIFKAKKAKYAQERSQQVRYLGPAQQKTETGSIAYDNDGGERWLYTMEPIEAAIGYIMSRKSIDDGQYKADFTPNNLGLQRAMQAFWSEEAAYVFNAAATYNTEVGGDGKAILATDHPHDGGTWANTSATPLALSEGSLISTIKLTQKFVDEAGIFINCSPEMLIVPINLLEVAIRLVKTELRPGTANNDVNAILTMAGGVKTYKPMKYLTGDYRWFLKTDIEGLLMLTRTPYETDMDVDFDTKSLKVSSYERKGFFCNDPRALAGQNVTA